MADQEKFEAAIADYTKAIEIQAKHCRAYYNRAFSHDRLRNYFADVEGYTCALKLEPNNPTAYHNRGSLYERLGNLQAAMHDFSRSTELDSKAALSFNARGLLQDKMAEHAAALADFNAAVALDPGNERFLRNNCALCHRACGNLQEAVRDFSAHLEAPLPLLHHSPHLNSPKRLSCRKSAVPLGSHHPVRP
eukprot:jgi/Tetstr1/433117/TSEL_022449.t1